MRVRTQTAAIWLEHKQARAPSPLVLTSICQATGDCRVHALPQRKDALFFHQAAAYLDLQAHMHQSGRDEVWERAQWRWRAGAHAEQVASFKPPGSTLLPSGALQRPCMPNSRGLGAWHLGPGLLTPVAGGGSSQHLQADTSRHMHASTVCSAATASGWVVILPPELRSLHGVDLKLTDWVGEERGCAHTDATDKQLLS